MRYYITTPDGQLERKDGLSLRSSHYLFFIDGMDLESWTPVADAIINGLNTKRVEAAMVAIDAARAILESIAPGAFIAGDVYTRDTHEGHQFKSGNCICSTYPVSMPFNYRVQMVP